MRLTITAFLALCALTPLAHAGAGRLERPMIVGGEVAQPGQFPWQAFVSPSEAYCGGTLITPE